MTFAEEIEHACGGAENIEAIVVGTFGWASNLSDEDAYGFDRNASRKPIPVSLKTKPQKWEDVRDYLHYMYDRGYGSPGCHAVYVYTADHVVFVSTYDGSTYLGKMPRNPVDCQPEMWGGG